MQTEVFLSPRMAFIQLNWTSMSGTRREAEKHLGDLRHQEWAPDVRVFSVAYFLCKQTGRADLDLWATC